MSVPIIVQLDTSMAAKTYAANSANSAVASAGSASSAATSAASALNFSKLAAASASASAWNASTIYNYPTVVAYTDGMSYRCIGENVVGDKPSESTNWVPLTLDREDFFEVDASGNLMPSENPTYSTMWALDDEGNIVPTTV